jgi:hypothetical protein
MTDTISKIKCALNVTENGSCLTRQLPRIAVALDTRGKIIVARQQDPEMIKTFDSSKSKDKYLKYIWLAATGTGSDTV